MTSPKILLCFTETNHPIVHRKLAQVTMHMHAHAGIIEGSRRQSRSYSANAPRGCWVSVRVCMLATLA